MFSSPRAISSSSPFASCLPFLESLCRFTQTFVLNAHPDFQRSGTARQFRAVIGKPPLSRAQPTRHAREISCRHSKWREQNRFKSRKGTLVLAALALFCWTVTNFTLPILRQPAVERRSFQVVLRNGFLYPSSRLRKDAARRRYA